jgi:hypothetical protein
MKRPAVFILFCMSVALLVSVRVAVYINNWQAEELPSLAGRSVVVEGMVAADPDQRDTSLHTALAVSHVGERTMSGTMLVLLPTQTDVAYGDRLLVEGEITLPQPFETNTGRMFNYAGYLEVEGIAVVMPKAKLLAREQGPWSIQKSLFSLKHFLNIRSSGCTPSPTMRSLRACSSASGAASPKI